MIMGIITKSLNNRDNKMRMYSFEIASGGLFPVIGLEIRSIPDRVRTFPLIISLISALIGAQV